MRMKCLLFRSNLTPWLYTLPVSEDRTTTPTPSASSNKPTSSSVPQWTFPQVDNSRANARALPPSLEVSTISPEDVIYLPPCKMAEGEKRSSHSPLSSIAAKISALSLNSARAPSLHSAPSSESRLSSAWSGARPTKPFATISRMNPTETDRVPIFEELNWRSQESQRSPASAIPAARDLKRQSPSPPHSLRKSLPPPGSRLLSHALDILCQAPHPAPKPQNLHGSVRLAVSSPCLSPSPSPSPPPPSHLAGWVQQIKLFCRRRAHSRSVQCLRRKRRSDRRRAKGATEDPTGDKGPVSTSATPRSHLICFKENHRSAPRRKRGSCLPSRIHFHFHRESPPPIVPRAYTLPTIPTTSHIPASNRGLMMSVELERTGSLLGHFRLYVKGLQ
mmetsp:Transcript_16390/g.33336  ORF Transcript_16390/g.33336 Transcript_16390/m.33336 type:complete len:390 (+) Transcript_16390:314-1483(+)